MDTDDDIGAGMMDEDSSCGSMFFQLADRRVLGWELAEVDGPNFLKISQVHAS